MTDLQDPALRVQTQLTAQQQTSNRIPSQDLHPVVELADRLRLEDEEGILPLPMPV